MEMKMKSSSILIGLCFSVLAGCGNSEPAVKIEVYENIRNQMSGNRYNEVVVTAITDEVIIEDILVNRGDCKRKYPFGEFSPVTLKFGRTISQRYSTFCSMTQVDVVTDDEVWSVSY